MKQRLLSLLLPLMLCGGHAMAQKLVVRNFKPRPSDLTANTHGTSHTDQNGQTAALIKINTTLDDLTFGGTNMGVVHTEKHPGEWWLYIPQRSQRITVHHPKYGSVEYFYDNPIDAAKTYEMELTFEGRDVGIETSVLNADLTIDGEALGTSPQNRYLAYGLHPVKARKGNMVYEGNINVTRDGDGHFVLKMVDERETWGEVTVEVDNNADIWFDDKKVGVGSWNVLLPAGDYVVETRAERADPQTTSFTVKPKQNETVKALPPLAHVGYLKLDIKPEDMTITDGISRVTGDPTSLTLGVGEHDFTFARDGYHPVTKTYRVRRDVESNDVVHLKPILFVKPTTAYVAAGFTYAGTPGVSVTLGGVISNIDISASYTFGFGESDPVYWYADESNPVYDQTCTYKVNTFAIRAGYQIGLNRKMAVTPTLGYIAQTLTSSGDKGEGLMCGSLGIGVKGLWVPVQHFGVYLQPEYAIPVQKNELGTQIAKIAGITKGGFMVTVGLCFNI